jgi:hypothetical protein
MLQQNAVPPATLELLEKISEIKQLNLFGLGGGTNLALRYGHRLSIDLDFFTNSSFDIAFLFQIISKKFTTTELLFEKNQTIMLNINDIKVDFVLYPFQWLQPFDTFENVRLLSISDMIPMKLQAVSNRNSKKDYWDIAFLMKQYSLAEMLKVFKLKFPQIDPGFIIHSLIDFENADAEPDPDTYINTTWAEVKLKLTNEVKKYVEGLL